MLNLRTRKRDAYGVLVEKPEGLRAPEMSRHNQEDNIGMNLKIREMEIWGWTYEFKDRDHWLSLVNMGFLTSRDTSSFL